ncbi:V-type ATP synthase subunit E [Candidatus Omnitrophota bacterium]
MARLKLLDIISEKSGKLCAEILEKKTEEAAEIIDKAKSDSEEMRSRVLQKVEAESNRLRERQHNTIRFRSNAQRYELKAQALESVWSETKNSIENIIRSDIYGEILEKLFFECLSEAPDGSEVRAAPADGPIVKNCIQKSGLALSFMEDTSVYGGVEIHWPDGKIVLKNTLPHRLSKLKAEGNAELSLILFAENEDKE